jgi:predicted PurR-regulated permease PerM
VEERKDEAAAKAVAVANEVSWTQTRAILRVIFIALAVAAVLWTLYALEGVILLVVLAVFFAYLISPLVEVLQRPFGAAQRVMPRVLAIAIVYLVIFGSIGIAIYLLLPQLGKQITQFIEQAPKYVTSARLRAQSLGTVYDRLQLPQGARDVINNLLTRIIESASTYTGSAFELVAGLLRYIPWLILTPILAFFLLKDADDFRQSALHVLPRGRWRWRGDELFQDINSTLASYIRAQLTACLIVGVICTLGFFLIGVPYWLPLGIIAGLFEFIPLAGPLAVAVITAVVTSFYGVGKVIAVLLFLMVLRGIQDYMIYPRIVGQGIHLHPLAVVLAILCGEELAGLPGIFLAIPVIAIISVTYRHWLEHKGSTGLVKDLLQPAETPATTTPDAATMPSLTNDGTTALPTRQTNLPATTEP